MTFFASVRGAEPSTQPAGSSGPSHGAARRNDGVDAVDDKGTSAATTGADGRVVPIETHCDGCEQLSDPPQFRCTHSEARVVELVDRDHVRVRRCPIAEQLAPDE